MLIRQKAVKTEPSKRLPFWLFVGASCLALAGTLGTISTRTVQADTRLQKPISDSAVVVSTPTLQLNPAPPLPAAKPHGEIYRGVASWYGSIFDGRKTASGEIFDMYAMTACHPTLPFGTLVKVVNLRNRKSVVVRITDRGDLGTGNRRIIDLSYGAAEKLQMTRSGLARVSLEVLALGHSGAVE